MAEGNVYLCSWVSEGEVFKLWLDKHPSICGQSRDFNKAYNQLWVLVCEKYGDGEAYLEFTTELPATGLISRFGKQEIVEIVGNERAEGPINLSDCYTGGLCNFCRKPDGKRNEIAGIYDSIPSGGGSFSRNGLANLFSEQFIDILSKEERSGLQFIKVGRKLKGSKLYYELIGASVADYVGVKNLAGRKGWECPTCNARWYGYYIQGFPIHKFVARSDLPNPLRSCFAIGNYQDGFSLCMTMKRWRDIVKRPERKGLVSNLIGLVEDRDLERYPILPEKKPAETYENVKLESPPWIEIEGIRISTESIQGKPHRS